GSTAGHQRRPETSAKTTIAPSRSNRRSRNSPDKYCCLLLELTITQIAKRARGSRRSGVVNDAEYDTECYAPRAEIPNRGRGAAVDCHPFGGHRSDLTRML